MHLRTSERPEVQEGTDWVGMKAVVKEDGPPARMDSARRLSYEIEYGCDRLTRHVELLKASE
jgi:hypothetical protein